MSPTVRDLCSSAGILASALVTFTVMFLPKGRQLALGKDNKVEVRPFPLLHRFYLRCWSSFTAMRTGPETQQSTFQPSPSSLATKV